MGTVARNRQHNQTTQQHSDPAQLVSSAGRAAELGAAALPLGPKPERGQDSSCSCTAQPSVLLLCPLTQAL